MSRLKLRFLLESCDISSRKAAVMAVADHFQVVVCAGQLCSVDGVALVCFNRIYPQQHTLLCNFHVVSFYQVTLAANDVVPNDLGLENQALCLFKSREPISNSQEDSRSRKFCLIAQPQCASMLVRHRKVAIATILTLAFVVWLLPPSKWQSAYPVRPSQALAVSDKASSDADILNSTLGV